MLTNMSNECTCSLTSSDCCSSDCHCNCDENGNFRDQRFSDTNDAQNQGQFTLSIRPDQSGHGTLVVTRVRSSLAAAKGEDEIPKSDRTSSLQRFATPEMEAALSDKRRSLCCCDHDLTATAISAQQSALPEIVRIHRQKHECKPQLQHRSCSCGHASTLETAKVAKLDAAAMKKLQDEFGENEKQNQKKKSANMARSPSLFITLPLLLSAFCSIGVIVRKGIFTWELPFESFYSSSNSNICNTAFKQVNQKYEIHNKLSPLEHVIIFRDKQNDNVLREDFLERYFDLRTKIKGVKVFDEDNRQHQFSTLCRRSSIEQRCEVDVIETLVSSGLGFSLQFPEMELLTFPNNASSANRTSLFLGKSFGGVETTDNGRISRVRSLATYFRLNQSIAAASGSSALTSQWSGAVRSLLAAEKRNDSMTNTYFWSLEALSTELLETMKQLWCCIGISLAMLMCGTVCFFLTKSCVTSNPWLGFTVFIGLELAIISTIAVKIGLDGSFNSVAFSQFFFITAIGLFLMFLLAESWSKFGAVSMQPGEKLQFIFASDAPCFVLCIATAGVAVGVLSIPAVSPPLLKSAIEFASLALISLLLYSLLFFGTALFLTGARQAAHVPWYQCCWSQEDSVVLPSKMLHRSFLFREMRKHQRKLFQAQASNRAETHYGRLMSSSSARSIALLVFCIYLIFAVSGCFSATFSLLERHFLSPGSELVRFTEQFEQLYTKQNQFLELCFQGGVDYFDNDVQKSVEDILSYAEDSGHVSKAVSWLRDYRQFAQQTAYAINENMFVPVVVHVFLHSNEHKKHASDIVFNTFQDRIEASRMYLELTSTGVDNQLALITKLKKMASDLLLPMSIGSSNLFLLSHDLQMPAAATIALTLYLCSSTVASLFLFAHPLLSLLLLIFTSSTVAGTVGFASFWGISLTAPNCVCILYGLLFTTISILTVGYHFLNSDYDSSKRRLEYTMVSCMGALLKSLFLSLISALPVLTMSRTFIADQAKLLFIHGSLTTVHCLFFLPASLALLMVEVPKWHTQFAEGVLSVLRKIVVCPCLQSTEDASSIYYIATSGRMVDPQLVKRFYQEKFREDITTCHSNSLNFPSAPISPAISPPATLETPPSSETMSKVEPLIKKSHAKQTIAETNNAYFSIKYDHSTSTPTKNTTTTTTSKVRQFPAISKAYSVVGAEIGGKNSHRTQRDDTKSVAGGTVRQIYIPKKYREGGNSSSPLLTRASKCLSTANLTKLTAERFERPSIIDQRKPTTTPPPKDPSPSGTFSKRQNTAKTMEKSGSNSTKTTNEQPEMTRSGSSESVYRLETDEKGQQVLKKIGQVPKVKPFSKPDEPKTSGTLDAQRNLDNGRHMTNKVSYAKWSRVTHDTAPHQRPRPRSEDRGRSTTMLFSVPVNPAMELRPEWKNSLLHGSVRQPLSSRPPMSRPSIFSIPSVGLLDYNGPMLHHHHPPPLFATPNGPFQWTTAPERGQQRF